MIITTWNINSIRLRINLLKKLCDQVKPDIICLQETKTEDINFPLEAIKNMGYEYIIYSGEKSYNGVAVISKFPIDNHFSLNIYNTDKRHICCSVMGAEIHNFYVPAGGDEPDAKINAKYAHKLSYVKQMKEWFLSNRSKTDKIILTGDFNIAPYENDVWSSKQLRNVISHTQIERDSLLSLKDSMSFIDTARYFIPFSEKSYSWWSYRSRDWKKSNRGRRLDHIWASQSLEKNLNKIQFLKEARDWVKPSDHIPYILKIDL